MASAGTGCGGCRCTSLIFGRGCSCWDGGAPTGTDVEPAANAAMPATGFQFTVFLLETGDTRKGGRELLFELSPMAAIFG